MAVLTPDTIASSILPYYERQLRDNIFMSTAFFEYMWQNVKPVPGGLVINEQIAYVSSPNAGVFAGGVAELPATFIGNTTQAAFPPCYYFYSVAIPDTTIILNENEGQIIDIIAAQYETAVMSLNNVLGSDVYGDSTPRNGAPTLSGLRAVVTSGSDPGGGAYGGISRVGSSGSFTAPVGNAPWWNGNALTINGGSQTVWKGTINTGTATTLTLLALQQLVTSCQVGMFRPKVVFCDWITYNAYFNLLTNIVREAPIAKIGRQGFTGLAFADIIVVQDDQCPSGYAFAVNDILKFRPWEGGFFRQLPWRQPPNSLVNIKYGLLIANMTHQRPNTMGSLSGITG
jgi:hypothetical protein